MRPICDDTRAPQRPPADGETTRQTWDSLTSADTPAMDVKPAAMGPAISRDNLGQPDVAWESPPHNPTTHNRATHSADACRLEAPARVASDYPTSAAGTQQCGPALAVLQPSPSSTNTNPTAPPSPNEFLPRIPGEGHAPRAPAIYQLQGKGRGPVILPDLSLPRAGHEVDRTKGCSQTRRTHGPADEHGNVTSGPARRVMRDPPASQHIIENVTSKGRGSRDACTTRADMYLLRES